ncbi:MAG: rhombosortase [Pseudomonadota bacterium]|nr:rhombosortase [Pseudomonadota bacterium]
MPFNRLIINRQGLYVYLLFLVCLIFGPWSDVSMQYFSMDRQALESGEYWRLWSGQFVHLSWTHLSLNIFALIILQQIFGRELNNFSWLLGSIIISPFIGICWFLAIKGNWLVFQDFDYVVGFSALLHGLFIYCSCVSLRRDWIFGLGVLIAILAKIIMEIIFGDSVFSIKFIGSPVAIDTHVYGVIGGILFWLLMLLISKKTRFEL